MIAIVNYRAGNLRSVHNVLNYLGAASKVTSNARDILSADKIILPGVGSFPHCIEQLTKSGLSKAIHECASVRKKPFLGICIGMQILARTGHEFGITRGLGWFDAEVIPFKFEDPSMRIPHIGWNNVKQRKAHPLFKGIKDNAAFYFVHSFHMKNNNEEDVVGTCNYGTDFTACICSANIFATQFHPEKSQDNGLKFFQNFIEWEPSPDVV